MYRSHCFRTHGIRGSRLGNTEVCDLDLTLIADNDILRLDVSMDNSLIMGSLDTTAYLNCNRENLFVVQVTLLLDISL